MNTNGKVQVQRLVHRGGKTFTQMFWVNPSEVKDTDKVVTSGTQESKPTVFFPDDLTRIAGSQGREAAMAAAQAFGITWKHSDNPGINWMRCSMAVKQASGIQTTKQSTNTGKLDTSNKSSVMTPELSQQVNAAPDSKQKIAILVSAMGRGGVMQWAKDNGITWKESDKPGINWMRCSMALKEMLSGVGSTSSTDSNDNNSHTETDSTPLTESKPEVNPSKTYMVPQMYNHVYDDTPFDDAIKAYYHGDYTEAETRQAMNKAMNAMGVNLDALTGDWDKISMASICVLGKSLSAVRDEFPQLGKGRLYVENTKETKKKHHVSYMTRHPGSSSPFVAFATITPLVFTKEPDPRTGENYHPANENGSVTDSDWGVCFCSDKGYDIADIANANDDILGAAHLCFDTCHELTHTVQFEIGRALLRSKMSECTPERAQQINTSYNVDSYYRKACELILRNAIKYLPPEEQKTAKRKRTAKGLAEVFSPTVYGCTNAVECIAEAMASHFVGQSKLSEDRERCEMVYISMREIYDRILDDPASVRSDLEQLKG